MSAPTAPAAVLFDMDGTLLDSERLWDIALTGLAERLGGRLSATARAAMVGRGGDETMAIFYQDLGLTGRDPMVDGAWAIERMMELYATDPTWRPGAADLLTAVRAAGLPTALVTSTGRRLVEVALETLGTFDAVVCGDEVSHAKPHPESYRTAATLLGVPITRSVAIEDSPAGVTSALAAGAVVLGVAGEVILTEQFTGVPGVHLVDSLTTVDLPYLARLIPA